MRKIKLHIISLLLVVFNVCVLAQDFCSTNSNIPDFLQSISQNQYVGASDSYTVKVFFHIIRRTNGTGGQTQTEVNAAFNTLRSDYQQYNICISLLGTDEINDDNTYNRSSFTSDNNGDGKFDNFSPNSHSDAIDIYLFANDKLNSGLAAGIPASALVIGGNAFGINLASSHVLSHELGHCLGLYHTFHGLCESGCAELVNGSNCTTCGDFVCDTPPDPQTFQVNQNTCQWNGITCGVANANTYNPLTNLLMAYMPPNCMLYHTAGQATRMKTMIANSPILQNVIVPNHLILSGTINGNNEYKAIDDITSTQIIDSGSTTYKSNEVELGAGFEVKEGAEFEITINEAGCQ